MKTPKIKRKKQIKPFDESIDSKLTNIVMISFIVFTIVIGVLSLPHNNYADLFLIFLILIPIVCILIIRFYNSLINFGNNSNNGIEFFLFPHIIILMFLLIRSYDINIIKYLNLLIVSIALTILLIFILVFKNDDFYLNGKVVWNSVLIYSIFPLFYSYGVVLNLNYTFDYSNPKSYHSRILSKRESHGKNDNYYFNIVNIDNQKLFKDLSVEENLYENTLVNDTVTLKIFSGLLNIPYYEVVEK